MSRVGKNPIDIPDKVKIKIDGQMVKITGPKGSLDREIHSDVSAVVKDNQVLVSRSDDTKRVRSLHGLTRALLNNMVVGVSEGFSRTLEIIGVGYRAEMKGKNLSLLLGYSHPIVLSPPDDISIEVEPKKNLITVKGSDKELVGLIAAKIRSFRKPEPYKGKGIRYLGEYVRSKAGKTAATSA